MTSIDASEGLDRQRTPASRFLSMKTLMSIIVVDDDRLILRQITALLADEGFDVRTAGSAEEALLLFSTISEVAALISDVRLPGMPGWRLARRMRQLLPSLPILYISADSADDWDREAVPRSLMLEKPFLPSALLDALRALLGDPAAGSLSTSGDQAETRSSGNPA